MGLAVHTRLGVLIVGWLIERGDYMRHRESNKEKRMGFKHTGVNVQRRIATLHRRP